MLLFGVLEFYLLINGMSEINVIQKLLKMTNFASSEGILIENIQLIFYE